MRIELEHAVGLIFNNPLQSLREQKRCSDRKSVFTRRRALSALWLSSFLSPFVMLSLKIYSPERRDIYDFRRASRDTNKALRVTRNI